MTIVFKVSDNIKNKIISYYEPMKKEKTPPYAIFQAQDADTTITLYESGKIMFQGLSADIEANIWIDMEKHLNNRIIDINNDKKDKSSDKKEIEHTYDSSNTVGSDEVGTGDYFGPIIVTAAFVRKEDINLLIDLGVKDSKKITDEKIIKIAPEIIKNIKHTTLILDNKTYNDHYSSDVNMNKIKAVLHNKALLNLIKKENNYKEIIIDQFVNPKKYFEYLSNNKEIVKNIKFYTKAEDKFLSVAAASIISRYYFIQKINELTDKYKIEIPKGAGPKVNNVAKEIIQKYGIDELNNIAKLNFKNTEDIKK